MRRRSSQRLRQYLGQEALHQTVKRVALKEKVGEGLVRRCVADEIGQRLVATEPKETPELIVWMNSHWGKAACFILPSVILLIEQ